MPLYPKKNLVPPFTDSRWFLATPVKVMGAYFAELKSDTPAWDTSKVTIDVVVGKTYYVQADIEGEFSVEIWENGTVNLGSFARKNLDGRVFTARYPTWDVRFVRNNQGVGYMNIKNLMVSEAVSRQTFEPYELGMKKAITGLPEKNLIPDFNDTRWFDDVSMVAPTVSVYADNPYGMRMVTTIGASGRMIHIPVESGKTYTFTFGKITSLYRIYKQKVTSHSTPLALTQDGSTGKPDSFTFTADDSYLGFVTFRFTAGSGGTYYVENLQLEEGGPTPFEPMNPTKLKPAKLIPKKNLVPPFPTWPFSNALSKMRFTGDYRLEYDADVNTIYYNVHLPFEKLKPYTLSAKYLSDYARVAIREVKADGSKIFITNVTAIYMQHTWTPASDTVKIEVDCTVKSLGPCVFEGIQLEPISATPFEPYELIMKPAILYPKKNLIPPFTDPRWTLLAPPTTVIISDYEVETSAVSGSNAVNIPVKPSTQYTFSAINEGASIYFIDSYNSSDVSTQRHTQPAGNTNDMLTFTTHSSAVYVRIIFRNSGSASKRDRWKNMMLVEGTDKNFEPYQLAMKQ
jgi:hypothetical protein